MAALSASTVKSLMTALTDAGKGNDVATKLNQADVLAAQTGWTIPAVIVATNVSTTIDFGALAVGDKVVIIPDAAGTAEFATVATAGTLPQAAVVGSLYVVLRSAVAALAAAPTSEKF